MRTHKASQKQSLATNSLVSRPFAVQPKLQENTESQGTQGYESQIPEFAILNPDRSQAMPVQPKLAIGAPGDKYEQEADQTAKLVVQRINTPAIAPSTPQPSIQRQGGLEGGEATANLESAITSARGGGQPLDSGVQERMSAAMGADFSGVRVHADAQSDELNRSIQAKAFTTGQDVFFRQGEYQPGSRGGQELIAHELTHVVQQNGGAVQRSPQQSLNIERIQAVPSDKAIQRAVNVNNVPISSNLLLGHRQDFIRDCTPALANLGIANITDEQWDNIFAQMDLIVQSDRVYNFGRTSELMFLIHHNLDIEDYADDDQVSPEVDQSLSPQEQPDIDIDIDISNLEKEANPEAEEPLSPQDKSDINALELEVAKPQAQVLEVEDESEQEVEKAQQEAPKAQELVRQGAEADPIAAVILSQQMDKMPSEAQEAAEVVKSHPEDVAALADLVIDAPQDVPESVLDEASKEPVDEQQSSLAAPRKEAEGILVEIRNGMEELQQQAESQDPEKFSDKAKKATKKAVKKTSDVVGPGMVAGPHTEAQGIHNYPSFDPKFGDTSAATVTQGFSHFGVALSALGDLATLVSGIIAVIDNKSLPQESAAEELFRINEQYKAWMTVHSGTFNLLKKGVDFGSLVANLVTNVTPAISGLLAGVSGGLGIGLSGIILVQQGRRAYKATKRAYGLHHLQLQSQGGKRLRDYAKAKQMRKVGVSGAQAVAAALGVSYGVATIVVMATCGAAAGAALAATPVGWVLLGGAALIGIGLGVYKLVRWWQRRKREKQAKSDASDTVQTRERMAELLIKLMKAKKGSKRRADAELITHTLNLSRDTVLSKVGKDAIMNKLASW
ncbi:DUF4157 domain-containing protein [Anabaena minutissima FACHB-250]|nr:DUF4157 domain-containing protein [Anabaena minutissima FACHB-250]